MALGRPRFLSTAVFSAVGAAVASKALAAVEPTVPINMAGLQGKSLAEMDSQVEEAPCPICGICGYTTTNGQNNRKEWFAS